MSCVPAGSLVAVPLLSGHLGVPDILLALIGASSGILEYVIYGFVSQARPFLIWIGECPVPLILTFVVILFDPTHASKFLSRSTVA